jgi:hypothetical protein
VRIALGSTVRYGSWLRENAEIEFANGNFVSTSINLKNKSAGDGCRDKTIKKTILRALRARTFSSSQGQSRLGRASSKSGHPLCLESGSNLKAMAVASIRRWSLLS